MIAAGLQMHPTSSPFIRPLDSPSEILLVGKLARENRLMDIEAWKQWDIQIRAVSQVRL